eukprot:3475271-Rhodomonas_salina.1
MLTRQTCERSAICPTLVPLASRPSSGAPSTIYKTLRQYRTSRTVRVGRWRRAVAYSVVPLLNAVHVRHVDLVAAYPKSA